MFDPTGEDRSADHPLRRVSPLNGRMRAGEQVLVSSPQVRSLSWSATDAVFVLACRGGRPIELVAELSDLPAGLRYEWVVITGDANEHKPLRSLPSIQAEMKSGNGQPANFVPIEQPKALFGQARVEFRFGPSPRVKVDRTALLVRDTDVYRSYVLSAPRAICERS